MSVRSMTISCPGAYFVYMPVEFTEMASAAVPSCITNFLYTLPVRSDEMTRPLIM